MGTCGICDGDEELPNRCNYCNGVFCVERRLPESHDCPGLDASAQGTRHFESAFDGSIRSGVSIPSGEIPYEVVDPDTLGTAPDPEYESSPDVNLDGSVASDEELADEEPESHGGFVSRLLSKLF